MVRGEVAAAGALGAAGDGPAGGVDVGGGASDVIVPGLGDGMGDVGDVPADGAACGSVAEGGVGDAPGVGVVGDANGERVVVDAPGVSAARDAFSDGEGAAGGVTAASAAGGDAGEGVAGDGSGSEFAHGLSSTVLGVGSRFFWRRAWSAFVIGWFAGPSGVGRFWCLGMSSPIVAEGADGESGVGDSGVDVGDVCGYRCCTGLCRWCGWCR